jgi:transposase
MVADRMRARHRLSKLLLRHGQVWRAGKAWTLAHERWLVTQRFTEPALQTTYDHYRAVLQSRDAQLEAIQADLAVWQDRAPFAEQVARLAAYRGVTRLGALHLAAESVTGPASPERVRSWASAGWCQANTPAAR